MELYYRRFSFLSISDSRMLPIKIFPSILSADFRRLGQQIEETESAGADGVHLDVMDGRFA
jgi:pentose-5-phosphate-3-epimerase